MKINILDWVLNLPLTLNFCEFKMENFNKQSNVIFSFGNKYPLVSGNDSNFLGQTLSRSFGSSNISLKYQPIIRIDENKIFGVEVLVCWSRPLLCDLNIKPDCFIELGERNASILPISTWIIETALNQSAVWISKYGPLVLAFNISESQLNDVNFCSHIRNVCEKINYPINLIEIEISEFKLIKVPEKVNFFVEKFAGYDLSLTVDGFGLSVHSTNFLENSGVKKVKFSKKLTAHILSDHLICNHIQHISSCATKNDIQLMVDGIASGDVVDEVRKINCNFGQGCYFGEPVTALEFTNLLSKKMGLSNL